MKMTRMATASTDTDLYALRLKLPEFSGDWKAVVAEAEGVEKDLLTVLARGANLLKPINDFSANFERVAWLSLWTKCFSTVQAALSALRGRSEYFLEVLSRTSFEVLLHVFTITEASPTERLRAYSAWCLWNDRSFQIEFVDPKTLDGIWDPQPAERILRDPNTRLAYEQLFGPINVETDRRTLAKGRLRQQHEERLRLHRLEAWLGHRDLRKWYGKLLAATKGKKKKQVNFFALFNESDRGVARRLESLQMRFLYVNYVKGSLHVHGTTVEHSFYLHEGVLTPRVGVHDESIAALAHGIGGPGGICDSAFIQLEILRRQLWR